VPLAVRCGAVLCDSCRSMMTSGATSSCRPACSCREYGAKIRWKASMAPPYTARERARAPTSSPLHCIHTHLVRRNCPVPLCHSTTQHNTRLVGNSELDASDRLLQCGTWSTLPHYARWGNGRVRTQTMVRKNCTKAKQTWVRLRAWLRAAVCCVLCTVRSDACSQGHSHKSV
jgi:hypothetical protein